MVGSVIKSREKESERIRCSAINGADLVSLAGLNKKSSDNIDFYSVNVFYAWGYSRMYSNHPLILIRRSLELLP